MACPNRLVWALAALAGCGVFVGGCHQADSKEDQVFGSASAPDEQEPEAPQDRSVVPFERDAGPGVAAVSCRPPKTSDHLPARSATTTRTSAVQSAGYPVADLFEQFKAHCVACHVDQGQGGFQLSWLDFRKINPDDRAALKAKMQKAIARIRLDDPKQFMPPPPAGQPFSKRAAGDPVALLASLLEAWVKQDVPLDVFSPDGDSRAGGGGYLLAKDVAMQMTNLGNCVPEPEGFASERTRSDQLDEMFAEAKELPERLEQTDLFTLDSAQLAAHGVVAFAPGYPLWSNDARKIRMVRVPRGESIRFDKETQSFSIPPNTRFYKTFLKKVIDKTGQPRFRKLETRLIVSRPDDDSVSDPFQRHTALFGTYIWNEQETEAVLLRDPLRNGKPFRDRLVTFYTDEQKVDQLIAHGTDDLQNKLREQNLSRKWAVPGSERCIHCHMGSASSSFVLGFMPLQIRRRPVGEGGVIPTDEHPQADADELNQLQRLIDYGVISGIETEEDVTPLEDSQGVREARNEHELIAQGYMLGNCSHCHNPRGFPSESAPELRPLLNFLPDTDKGGIFQFPLERTSPRIFRGPDQNIPIPYITPSLYDMPGSYGASEARAFAAKTVAGSDIVDDREVKGEFLNFPDLAPWRSLIYRNVSTPFSYSDDYTIFPHMPRDTSGFDCRAQQLLGSWMVSIEARRKRDAQVKALAFAAANNPSLIENPPFSVASYPEAFDSAPDMLVNAQPYEEVPANASFVETYAVTGAAVERLKSFQEFGRYQQCPDPTADIVDPKVDDGFRTIPAPEPAAARPCARGAGLADCVSTNQTVPERPHWFVLDLTDPPLTTWAPRRGDWRDVFQTQGYLQDLLDKCVDDTCKRKIETDFLTVYQLTGKDPRGVRPDVQPVLLTPELQQFALSPLPMSTWRDPSGKCDFAHKATPVRTAESYKGAERPKWMDRGGIYTPPTSGSGGSLSPIAPDARIYEISPGAQVFGTICANCHGPSADSHGRMAETISDLTGGATRVANLRDGLLGQLQNSSTNLEDVFGLAVPNNRPGDSASPTDWAARYVAWMGLGGTQRVIPLAVLNVVAVSNVFGFQRGSLGDLKSAGGNMLALAEHLCKHVLPMHPDVDPPRFDIKAGDIPPKAMYPVLLAGGETLGLLSLLSNSGDAELWQKICTFNNPLPVRVVQFTPTHGSEGAFQVAYHIQRSSYSPQAPVYDGHGDRKGQLAPDNEAPWCVALPQKADTDAALAAWRKLRPDDQSGPVYCPAGAVYLEEDQTSASLTAVREKTAWAHRGAMNAGLVVFAYLQALNKKQVQPAVPYDKCEVLP